LSAFSNDDNDATDAAWCAYMLAIEHECVERCNRIEEFGLGAGRS
jgi:hypothetical protein